MVATLLRPPQEGLLLPAGPGLAFIDSATGQPVVDGLRLSLLLRRGGRLLGRAVASASGAWHWPDLDDRWRQAAPGDPVLADVVVRDLLDRFLPLSLPWPLPAIPAGQITAVTVLGSARLLQVSLLSAPGRRAPPGMVSVFGQLVGQASGQPVAWARIRFTDTDSRVHEGSTDAEGRLALHLAGPRPQRPAAPAPQLSVFSAPALGTASLGLGAPDVLAFASQPAAVALADAGGATPYAPPVFNPGEPLILATLGLPATQRELRLAGL
ncbi:MAG: hypothetical protein EKK53_03680 [Burkholderiales bacterium]|nr:MAG: hypothetical protein EKK53_03680 [Burkholderiales bacterium]